MNKYLAFTSGNFEFLLNINHVVEVFDCNFPVEDINDVLVGDTGDVYWRGKRALLVNFCEILQLPECNESNINTLQCYVVCKAQNTSDRLIILQVSSFKALQTIDESVFEPMHINNSNLNKLCNKVMTNKTGQISFLLEDVERLFV